MKVDPDHDSPGAPVPSADRDVILGFERITPGNFMSADLSRAFGLADHAQ